MAKHKKTRKQKVIADFRHNVYTLGSTNIPSYNPTIDAKITNKDLHSYSYVFADVSKTGLLTITIVVLELILFFALKKHVLSIPNLNY